ncbi:MAG: hypothetical protein Q8N89_09875 [Azonexus sp.]|nr:hypothetical protein [Azonexus sp.]
MVSQLWKGWLAFGWLTGHAVLSPMSASDEHECECIAFVILIQVKSLESDSGQFICCKFADYFRFTVGMADRRPAGENGSTGSVRGAAERGVQAVDLPEHVVFMLDSKGFHPCMKALSRHG